MGDNFAGRKVLDVTNSPHATNAERLVASEYKFKRVDVFAMTGNSSTVWVGYNGTSALSGNEQGAPLAAGDAYTFYDSDLARLFVAGTTDGDGVTFNVQT